MAVKMKSGALATHGADRWYVSDGANAVGPVKLELLARGIEGGRVPLDSFVRHEAWKVWRPLTDFTDRVDDTIGVFATPPMGTPALGTPALGSPALGSPALGTPALGTAAVATSALAAAADAPLPQFPLSERGDRATPVRREAPKPPSLMDFASAEGVPARASTESVPPPRASVTSFTPEPAWTADDELASDPGAWNDAVELSNDLLSDADLELRPVFERTDDIPDSADGKRGWGQARPADSTDALPDDDLRGAADLSDALLFLLGGSVKRTRADVALLHRMTDSGAVVACAHGLVGDHSPLGLHTSFVDPIVVAAASGNMVLAEPSPGSAGSAMLRRLSPNLSLDAIETTGPHLLLPGERAVAHRPIVAALMLPVMVRGRLFGLVELGKSAPFTPRDVTKADDLVRAFTKLVESGSFAI